MLNEKEIVINKISKAENINNLPLIRDIENDFEDIDIYEAWSELDGQIVTIEDGTKVKIVKNEIDCFEKCESFEFYYIEDKDFYICAGCGLMQKVYEDIFKEESRNKNTTYEPKALPLNWKTEGIRKYYRNGIDKRTIKIDTNENKYSYNVNNGDCLYCSGYKNGECMYGYYNEDLECDEWEEM